MISTTRRRRSAGTGTGGIGSGGAGSTAAPLVVDGRVQIQATPTAASDSDGAQQTVRDVRAALHVLPGGDRMLVGRTTAIHLDTLDNSKLDLRVIPAILIAVLLVLILLLRSWVAPLLLVAATVLSFGTALGVSALIFNSVFHCPKADPAVPLFALIFLMTRAREEVALHGPKEGVLRPVRVTSGVITSAGIVLAKTSAVLAVIPILFLAQIAFIVAFGVLGDTLIVRTLIVPVLSYDLGRFTWWPIAPKPSRHQRESEEALEQEEFRTSPARWPGTTCQTCSTSGLGRGAAGIVSGADGQGGEIRLPCCSNSTGSDFARFDEVVDGLTRGRCSVWAPRSTD